MQNSAMLKQELKRMVVDALMLQLNEDEIGDDQALFGPGSLGLDSIDALQIVVSLEKNYGLKVPSPEAAREAFRNISTMAEAVSRHLESPHADFASESRGMNS